MPEEIKTVPGHDIARDPAPANDNELAKAGLYTEETIPGVPNELVAAWRKQYGKLFVIFHLQTPYVYRSLGYHEYKALRKEVMDVMKALPKGETPQDDLFKELALKKYVLWPQNFKELMDNPDARLANGDQLPGGIPYILGEYLVASSGFIEAEPFVLD